MTFLFLKIHRKKNISDSEFRMIGRKKNQILFLAKFYVMFSILWDKKKESMSRKQAKFMKISANLFILENDPYAWILAFIADLYYV